MKRPFANKRPVGPFASMNSMNNRYDSGCYLHLGTTMTDLDNSGVYGQGVVTAKGQVEDHIADILGRHNMLEYGDKETVDVGISKNENRVDVYIDICGRDALYPNDVKEALYSDSDLNFIEEKTGIVCSKAGYMG